MMGTPRRSNAKLQISNAESEDEDETESASGHVVSRDGHEELSCYCLLIHTTSQKKDRENVE